MKFLDILKKSATKVNVVDIEAALDNARADMVQALADRAAAESEYRSVLLDADSTLAIRAREKMSNAELDRDRAEAAVEALTIRLAEARERDEQDRRRVVYENAKAQADAAAKRLRDEYPKAAQAIVQVIVELARAEAAALEANSALPKGFAPLPAPEALVRDEPAMERQILGEKVVEVWCYSSTGNRIPQELAQQVKSDGNGGHFLADTSWASTGAQRVEQRPFRRIEFIPSVLGRSSAPMARSLSLPGMAPNEDFWAPLAASYGPVELHEIEAAMIELAATQHSIVAKPHACVEFIPIAEKATESLAPIKPRRSHQVTDS